MKRTFLAIFVAGVTLAPLAHAAAPDARHMSIGLGFRGGFFPNDDFPELLTTAPIGLRWWFAGQKVGLDLGVGFRSHEVGSENLTDWSFEAGVPFVFSSWTKVHALFRPGINYASRGVFVGGETDSDTYVTVSAEIEAEAFLADNLSFSASHGLAFVSYNPADPTDDSTTAWGTFGNNFTRLGFHLYLWGPQP